MDRSAAHATFTIERLHPMTVSLATAGFPGAWQAGQLGALGRDLAGHD